MNMNIERMRGVIAGQQVGFDDSSTQDKHAWCNYTNPMPTMKPFHSIDPSAAWTSAYSLEGAPILICLLL